MTYEEALAFVVDQGVVLASGKGHVPSMTETIAGETIRGSWWAHPQGKAIYAILSKIEREADILVCRLVSKKITFVHRRLWPALVQQAEQFSIDDMARIYPEHTKLGHHRNHVVPFPDWVPEDVKAESKALSAQAAQSVIEALIRPSR